MCRRHDHVDVRGDQFGDESGKPLIGAFGPSILDEDVLALDVAEVTQPLAEGSDEVGLQGRSRVAKEADPRELAYVLRGGGQWCRKNGNT